MNSIVILIALALFSCGALASGKSRRSRPDLRASARGIGALLLLALAGFGSFGFLASYEVPTSAQRLPWQLGYAVLGITALGGASKLIVGSLRQAR